MAQSKPKPTEGFRPLGGGRRSSGRKAARQDDQESWMMTYMDVVTLLLAAFIVILSLSNFEIPGTEGLLVAGRTIDDQQSRDLLTLPRTQSAATRVQQRLALVEEGRVSRQGDTVRLDLPGEFLFESGSANLSARGAFALDKVATVLAESGSAVSVEGHTDDVPIETARFPSNWELSSARAAAVVRYLIGQGLGVERLRAIGYAQTRPQASNATPEGRATNRRVTLVLHPGS